MTAIDITPDIITNAESHADYVQQVVSFNLGLLLASKKGKSQSGLAKVLGVRPQTVSAMIQRQTCTVKQLVAAADYLDTTPEALMDDTVMQLLTAGENKKTAVGDTRLRSFVEPVPPVGFEPTLHRF